MGAFRVYLESFVAQIMANLLHARLEDIKEKNVQQYGLLAFQRVLRVETVFGAVPVKR